MVSTRGRMPLLQPDISSCELGFHLPHFHNHQVYHDTQLPDDQLARKENIFLVDLEE